MQHLSKGCNSPLQHYHFAHHNAMQMCQIHHTKSSSFAEMKLFDNFHQNWHLPLECFNLIKRAFSVRQLVQSEHFQPALIKRLAT